MLGLVLSFDEAKMRAGVKVQHVYLVGLTRYKHKYIDIDLHR